MTDISEAVFQPNSRLNISDDSARQPGIDPGVRPDVEAGRHSNVVTSVQLDIVSLGVSKQRLQVGTVIPQIDPHVFNVHGIPSPMGMAFLPCVYIVQKHGRSGKCLACQTGKTFASPAFRLPWDECDGSADELTDYFRNRRRELIEFLERVVGLREATYCDLQMVL